MWTSFRRAVFGLTRHEQLEHDHQRHVAAADDFIAGRRNLYEQMRGQKILPAEHLVDGIFGTGALLDYAVLADGLVFHDGKASINIPYHHEAGARRSNLQERASALGTHTAPRDGVIALCDGKGRHYLIPQEITRKSDGIRINAQDVLSGMGFAKADWIVPVAAIDIPLGRMQEIGFVSSLPVNHAIHLDVQHKLRRGYILSERELRGFVERIRSDRAHSANEAYWDPQKSPSAYR